MSNKELDYRAWDGKTMAYLETDGWFDKSLDTMRHPNQSVQLSAAIRDEKIIVMEFTGLKDDEGDKVYDQDIVVDINNNHLLVEWNDDICQWQFNDGSPINSEGRYGTYKRRIGNIFQSPELLDTTRQMLYNNTNPIDKPPKEA